MSQSSKFDSMLIFCDNYLKFDYLTMEEGLEIDRATLEEEARAFNSKQQLDKLNQLIKIDLEGTMKHTKGRPTSTIDIPETKANKKARDLGFTIIPSKKVAPKSK